MLRFYRKYRYFLFIIFVFISFICNKLLFADTGYYLDKRFKVAVLREESFPSSGIPRLLTPEWLYDSLSEYFSIRYADVSQLSDSRYLNVKNFDLLILPYGETFPHGAFETIKKFLFEGGGLFNLAGRPFWIPVDKIEGKWERIDKNDSYGEFLSQLGIKYYEHSGNNIGLSVATGLSVQRILPTRGNVFPYRIPVRDFYFSDEITGKNSQWPIVFVKAWQNPYIADVKNTLHKYCFIGAIGESNPLNPEDPLAVRNLIQIMRHMEFPIIIHETETEYAAYGQNDKIIVSAEIINQGNHGERCIINTTFLDTEGSIVYQKERSIKLRAGQRIVINESWHPREFRSNFYKVEVTVKRDKEIFDKDANGFVVINNNILNNGPAVDIIKDKFVISGEPQFLIGTNYYESRLGELMWLRPNILRIREDFKSMRSLGLNFVRIHYHHSKWFRDYFRCVLKQRAGPYFAIADATALPSKRSWRILDAIIQLAQEQGLVLCLDLFSLVPSEMGDPIGWLGLKERIIDNAKIEVQNKFIASLAGRYKNVPGITWDLWNEPRLDKDGVEMLRGWAKKIKQVFRDNGDNHSITVGDDLSLFLLDVLDYASIHTSKPEEFIFHNNINKPFVFQEVWNDAGCGLKEEARQSDKISKDFHAFLKTKSAGFVPWQWTRQARLWNNISDAERWDDDLGLCVHEDGTLKPSGRAYSALINAVKK